MGRCSAASWDEEEDGSCHALMLQFPSSVTTIPALHEQTKNYGQYEWIASTRQKKLEEEKDADWEALDQDHEAQH
jgi:hypothetical protein